MNCRKVNSLLSAYIDGELTGVEQMQVRQHLRLCACCHEEHESLLMTKRLLAGLRTKAPRCDLEQIILRRLDAEGASRSSRLSGRAWWAFLSPRERLRVAALGTLAALALLVVSVLSFQPGRQENGLLARLPESANTMPSPNAGLRMPMQDFLHVHNTMEDARPFGSGPTITPAGSYRIQYENPLFPTQP